ncbi:MAG: type II toxin-antitoxin system prevent-host-death family antitoxin [Oscillospiraceae bacterium]|nr:type II toxin-antitoxin system prevent-host-death family antitoxin [Oscillospiraceae bacterium]
MEQINIHAAKTQLSALVERAAAGEPFIIAKAGRPLVTVSPYKAPEPLPRIGFLKGQIRVPDDFDRMGEEEITAMFEGSFEDSGNSI